MIPIAHGDLRPRFRAAHVRGLASESKNIYKYTRASEEPVSQSTTQKSKNSKPLQTAPDCNAATPTFLYRPPCSAAPEPSPHAPLKPSNQVAQPRVAHARTPRVSFRVGGTWHVAQCRAPPRQL